MRLCGDAESFQVRFKPAFRTVDLRFLCISASSQVSTIRVQGCSTHKLGYDHYRAKSIHPEQKTRDKKSSEDTQNRFRFQ